MRRFLAAALILLALPLAAAAAPVDELDRRIGRIMATEVETPGARRERLAALGVEAIPSLFDALERGAAWMQGESGVPAWTPLDPVGRTELRAALGSFPPGALRAFLASLLAYRPEAEVLRTGMSLLGDVGGAEDLGLLHRLATPGDDEAPVDRDTRRVFETEVGRILDRDPEALGVVPTLFGRAHPALLASLARATAATRGSAERRLAALLALVELREEAELFVLSEVARVSRDVLPPVEVSLLTPLRARLRWGDEVSRRVAVSALGRLGDYESFPEVLRLLEADDGNTRNAAVRALEDLTGLALGPDAEDWNRWHEQELAWWQDRVPALTADLRSSDPGRAVEALLAIAPRRLNRDELAGEVLAALDRDEPQVVHLACVVLGQLGSGSALEPLERMDRHGDPAVRRAARQAHDRIAGGAPGAVKPR